MPSERRVNSEVTVIKVTWIFRKKVTLLNITVWKPFSSHSCLGPGASAGLTHTWKHDAPLPHPHPLSWPWLHVSQHTGRFFPLTAGQPLPRLTPSSRDLPFTDFWIAGVLCKSNVSDVDTSFSKITQMPKRGCISRNKTITQIFKHSYSQTTLWDSVYLCP